MPLFQVNAFFQAQFDAAVASLWLYTRQVFLSANTRGFALAGPRRSEFAECFASLEETIDKVIEHLTNEAMKPIFDVRQAVTQVEIHLNTQLDLVKDTIIKGTNQQCLQRTQPQLTEYALAMAYRDFNLFLQRGLQEASQRTLLDYNARFTSDLGFAVRQIIQIRAAIQAARTREAIGSFVSVKKSFQGVESFIKKLKSCHPLDSFANFIPLELQKYFKNFSKCSNS